MRESVSGGGGVISGGRRTPRVLHVNTTAASTGGTSEETLLTYTFPGGTLSKDGDVVRIEVWGTTAANANTKRVRAFLGASTIAGTDDSNAGPNNKDWWLGGVIVRTGASAQGIFGRALLDAEPVGMDVKSDGSETLANDIDIVLKGRTPTQAGDITVEGFRVIYEPGP